MTEKPKTDDPGSTHIPDDADIEELEELTLTSVIRGATDLPEPEPFDDDVQPGPDDLGFDILSPKDPK